MLYYLIKFIKLCFNEPNNWRVHYAKLKREWTKDRVGKRVNQTAIVSFQYFRNRSLLHKTPDAKCDAASCLRRQLKYIIDPIDQAQYSIDVAIYLMDSCDIADALRRASERGVRVRVVCFKNYELIQECFDNCVLLRRLSVIQRNMREMTMHHKFCIIDGYIATRKKMPKALTVCITGSMNWVMLPRNCEDCLVTSSPRVAKRLEQEFDRIWMLCEMPENANYLK
ncbi:PREDICTED: mitochondrial cardiolipin hydrolase-like [Drosophila arizonae]|uniref:Mitochondrial cardiolipin hydrolase n=1 Tax=Drosophila arizonae TaxID=7263 RepID=A0ABM1Q162_DROAR|nr:PREDICTED: mitochondrial cardiolipin hydrolase-like [Drosophila arizonae]